MEKSKGHICFDEKYEYFAVEPSGHVYRAPLSGYIGVNGYRSGARYEGPSVKWLQEYFAAHQDRLAA